MNDDWDKWDKKDMSTWATEIILLSLMVALWATLLLHFFSEV